MAGRKNIHFNRSSENYLQKRNPKGQINYSGSIKWAFEMLEHLALDCRPDLNMQEWAEVYKIYRDADLSKVNLPMNIAADMMKYYGATVNSQLPEFCRPFVEKLAAMSQYQQFAVLDAVRVYWAEESRKEI